MSKVDFYRNVGYLTYAIATSDNSIPKNHIKFMKNELMKIWFQMDNTDTQNEYESFVQIELIFNWLLSHGLSSGFAMNCFTDFVEKNQQSLTESYRRTLISYSEKVASKLYTKDETLPILDTVNKILQPFT